VTKYSSDRARSVQKVQDEIQGYTTQLASDNEARRLKIVSLLADNQKLLDRVELLEEERASSEARERKLRCQLLDVEVQQEQEARDRIRMERRNAELTHLYVACHRLHEGLERRELFLAIEEILGSIVGCEEFALYELDRDRGVLRLTDSVGIEAPRAEIPVGSGRIGRAAVEPGIDVSCGGMPSTEDGITACIPLLRQRQVIGVIALFGLLEHKRQLGELDSEVFEILSQQAGGALHSATCYERSLAARRGE